MQSIQSSQTGKLPLKESFSRALGAFTRLEWYLFMIFFTALIASTVGILWRLNNQFLVEVPTHGGTITEGMVGTPRFINPILALSDADRDLTSLVYSGLVREMPNGEIVPDLAESFTVSEDGLTYTFILKQNALFHDETPVTADDVLFTIELAKDPILKSPKRLNWEGVEATKIDERTIEFALRQPYSSFLQYATIGILPMHLWHDLRVEEMSFSDLNTVGIGSGPYMIDEVKKKSSGVPEFYELQAFKKFALGTPYISTLEFKFYANERELVEALRNNDVEQIAGLSPVFAKEIQSEGFNVANTTLPRIFGLFLNQNHATLFTDKNVRAAINMAIDKEAIVRDVLHGFGSGINSAVPTQYLEQEPTTAIAREEAIALLAKGGWSIGDDGVLIKKDGKSTRRLEFSIATVDSPELRQIAEYLKRDIEAIGGRVDIKVYDLGTLNQSVIRPRKYDALLFGEIVNHESDLFAFWHSSQRNDPGLNIASYTNAKVDKILEDIIKEDDRAARQPLYESLDKEMSTDQAAVFIYSPDFIYVLADEVHNIDISGVAVPSDRFANVHAWYTNLDRVWKIFINN